MTASPTTRIPPMRADWTASGACTSGSTARPGDATRRGSGGAATTSTRAECRSPFADPLLTLCGRLRDPLSEQADHPPQVDQDLREEEIGAQQNRRHAGRYDVRQRLADARVQDPHSERIGDVEPARQARAERGAGGPRERTDKE